MRRTLVVLALLGSACSGPGQRAATSVRVVDTPAPASAAPVTVSTPQPTPVAIAAPVRISTPTPTPAVDRVAPFRGLGSWIDVFDHTDDPNSVVPLVRAMADRGVRVLYLETARFTSPTDIHFPNALAAALDEAKARGMRVVAWYPPAFDDMERDLRRSVVAASYVSPGGNRFNAFAADIEYETGVPDPGERSRRAVEYSTRLRQRLGSAYPLSAIVIPPTSLERNPQRWPAFPWAELSGLYDVFMPMNYWTANQRHPAGAKDLTSRNVSEVRRLTGKPVHIIGGLGADADEPQVVAYTQAALEAGSIGGGLYDFQTTRPEVWDELQAFAR